MRKLVAMGVLAGALFGAQNAAASTFIVNRTGDEADAVVGDGLCLTAVGGCTLRAAIQEANVTAALDQIQFAILGTGVQTINVTSQTPFVSKPVTIDGYTQPGASANTKAVGNDAVILIELKGAAGTGVGLDVVAGGSTVRGLAINSFPGAGIQLSTNGANVIEGNFVGTDATGTLDLGNGNYGIFAIDEANTIGGPDPADRNVISGNGGGTGSHIATGPGSGGTTIQNNYIGTNEEGTAAIDISGCSCAGINLFGGASGGLHSIAGNVVSGNSVGIQVATSQNFVSDNLVGTNASGTAAVGNTVHGVVLGGVSNQFAGNVVSGNNSGLLITGSSNVVRSNLIGTDAAGSADLGNAATGVIIFSGASNTIGGTGTGDGNVISGNTFAGIDVQGDGAYGNLIQGNFIGTDATGTQNLGNDLDGVLLRPGTTVVGGSTTNTVGGSVTGARNVIAFNGRDGVFITGSPTGNLIRGNSIHSNGTLGIDLGVDGVTPNDPGDGDAGANQLQNFPVLTSATTLGGNVTITGTLNSLASESYTLEFFANAACDSSLHGEAQTPLGTGAVATDTSGNATFSFSFANGSGGNRFTATATNQGANTSELARCVQGVPVNCQLAGTTLTIDIPANGAAAVARNAAGEILVTGAGTCGGQQPTVNNVALIDVDGDAGGETLTIDLSAGPFAPGAPGGDTGPIEEIEWNVDLGAGEDELVILGSSGADTIRLGSLGVNLNTDNDADIVLVGAELVTVNGGTGADVINGLGAAGNDPGRWPGVLHLNGEGGQDKLNGGLADDVLDGGLGADTLTALKQADGADDYLGGAGTDTISYASRDLGVSVTLDLTANDGAAGENDDVRDVEILIGGKGDDVLDAGELSIKNTLRGGIGDDDLYGGPNGDQLIGEAGADDLFGEAGKDTLNAQDGVTGNDTLDGGTEVDTCKRDAGDSAVNCEA